MDPNREVGCRSASKHRRSNGSASTLHQLPLNPKGYRARRAYLGYDVRAKCCYTNGSLTWRKHSWVLAPRQNEITTVPCIGTLHHRLIQESAWASSCINTRTTPSLFSSMGRRDPLLIEKEMMFHNFAMARFDICGSSHPIPLRRVVRPIWPRLGGFDGIGSRTSRVHRRPPRRHFRWTLGKYDGSKGQTSRGHCPDRIP